MKLKGLETKDKIWLTLSIGFIGFCFAALAISTVFNRITPNAKAMSVYTESYNQAHETEFNGHLNYIDHGNTRPFRFSIEGDDNFYKLFLYETGPTYGHSFHLDAEIGDSIIKSRYSDTMTLFKNDKRYYYRISKP